MSVPTSWLFNSNSETLLLDWAQGYLNSEYEVTGVVDILSHEETVYKWDKQASNYIPRSKYFLMIYKRQT